MALLMEEDKSLDPADIRLLRMVTEVARMDCLADLIKQFWLRGRCRGIDRGAALGSISAQWIYLGAFQVVSSRSQRRLGFD